MTASEFRSSAGLEIGDRVVDIDQPPSQRSPARVVEATEENAEEFTIRAIGETVADLNPDHPRDAQDYPYIRPETRGECCRSREDNYRPDVEGAICCWECNGGGRRPSKYRASDPVPPNAPCRTYETRDPSDTLNLWVHDRVAPAIAIEQDIARAANPEYGRLHSDVEHLRGGSSRARRSAILRIAYEATVGGVLDEEYNHSRTIAYLRDLDVDTHAVLPGGDPYMQDGGGYGLVGLDSFMEE